MKINIERNYKSLLFVLMVLVIGCNSEPAAKTKPYEMVSETDHNKSDLQIIDISQKQLHLYNQHLNTDSAQRVKIFRDSIYYPYQEVWDGYLGNIADIGATRCPECGESLIGRKGSFTADVLDNFVDGICKNCNTKIEGVWE